MRHHHHASTVGDEDDRAVDGTQRTIQALLHALRN
jgi:hypothetical protein